MAARVVAAIQPLLVERAHPTATRPPPASRARCHHANIDANADADAGDVDQRMEEILAEYDEEDAKKAKAEQDARGLCVIWL